jgi:hypothetical protein
MKTDPKLSEAFAVMVVLGLFMPSLSRGVEGAEGITAVASKVSNDYVRTKLPDGSFQVETYAFGNGGNWGGPFPDDTIDKLGFLEIARVIATPLASQNYISAKDPNKTELLIMVYWGTTTTPDKASFSPAYIDYQSLMQETNLTSDPGVKAGLLDSALMLAEMANRQRDHLDYKNAAMLGYDSVGLIGTEWGDAIKLTALKRTHDDYTAEIEANRYFVVLMAYDFQMMWKQKKHKLLWETRFSINQPRNDFGKALPVMAATASKYFGQESHGLVRQVIPAGHVEIHEPTLIELLEGSKK